MGIESCVYVYYVQNLLLIMSLLFTVVEKQNLNICTTWIILWLTLNSEWYLIMQKIQKKNEIVY